MSAILVGSLPRPYGSGTYTNDASDLLRGRRDAQKYGGQMGAAAAPSKPPTPEAAAARQRKSS